MDKDNATGSSNTNGHASGFSKPNGNAHTNAGEKANANTEKSTSIPIFPELAWRGQFKLYRSAMDGTTEASDAAHFQTFWAFISARLGRRIHWKSGSIIYPNAYHGFYGPSGDNKTTAQKRILLCQLFDDFNIPIIRSVGSAEGLGDALEEAGGGAYLFMWDEFCQVYSINRYDGGALMAHLTETFDCPDTWERIFRKKPINVLTPTPTVLTGTTPDWFWKNAKADDFHGGFLNRFLWMTGARKPPIPNPTETNGELIHNIKQHLKTLDEMKTDRGAHWTADASKLWVEFYIHNRRAQLDGILGAALKRSHVYVRKLCLIYSWLEGTYPEVTAEQLQASIAVIAYSAKCTQQLIEMQKQGDEMRRELELRIIQLLKKHPEGIKYRKLQQRICEHKGDSETLHRVVKSLDLTDQITITGENIIHLNN